MRDYERPRREGGAKELGGEAAGTKHALVPGMRTLTESLPPHAQADDGASELTSTAESGTAPSTSENLEERGAHEDASGAVSRSASILEGAEWEAIDPNEFTANSDDAPGNSLPTTTVQTTAVQRHAEHPAAPTREASAVAADGMQGSGNALPHVDAIQASFGKHDVSQVRSYDGGDAADAAAELDADGFAMGGAVAFRSAPDLRTAAHEAAHVVQQRAGHAPAGGIDQPGDALEQSADEVADAVVAGRSAEPLLDRFTGGGGASATSAVQRLWRPSPYGPSGGTSKTPPPDPRIGTAEEYVKAWARQIIEFLHVDMRRTPFETGVEGVTWKGGSAEAFNERFNGMFLRESSYPWGWLANALAPDPVAPIVDRGRDVARIPAAAKQWNQGVPLEIEKALRPKLVESLHRMVPRYAAVWNQSALAAERSASATKRAPGEPAPIVREPDVNDVRVSAPIDVYVRHAIAQTLAIDFKRYRAKHTAEQRPYELDKLGKVSLEIQWQQRTLHWARATPATATAEDVAHELYGSDAMAYLITPAPPLFGFDASPEHRGKLEPRYREELDKINSSNAYRGTNPPMRGTYGPEGEVLAGPLGNEAALNQAKDVTPTPNVKKPAIVARMRGIVNTFTTIQKHVARWGQESVLDGAKQRVDDRSRQLDQNQQEARALDWDGQTQKQVEILGSVTGAVEIAAKQHAAFTDPNARWLIVSLVRDYIEVAAVSDLIDTASVKLAAVEEKSRQFPADLLDALLESMRPAIHEAKIEKTGAGGDVGSVDTSRYNQADLDKRQHQLRHALTKLRELIKSDPAAAELEIKRITAEIDKLSTEVSMVSSMDACESAWAALHDNITVIGGAISVVSSKGNDQMRADQRAVTAMHEQWKDIYTRWKKAQAANDRKQMTLVENELKAKAKSEAWTKLFHTIGQHIQDNQTLQKWVTFGVMVGIAIVTGGIGAAVETGVGAAWGAAAGFVASTAVEAATFTTMSYLIVTKDPSLSGYFHELGKSALTFAALKGLGKIYGAAVGKEVAQSGIGQIGGILVQFTALNGHALYEADQHARKTKGRGLNQDEILDISFENLAFIGAVTLGGVLAKPFLRSLVLSGKLHGELYAVRAARSQAAELAAAVEASKGKDIARAHKLQDTLRDALAKEQALLAQLAERLKAYEGGDKKALSERQYRDLKAAMGEHEANVQQFQRNEIAGLLEPGGPSHFYVARGRAFDAVVDHYGKHEPGTTVKLGPVDPVIGARTAEITNTKDGSTWRITERVGAKAGELVRAPETAKTGAAARQKNLGRSNHDGHEGTYVAESPVQVAGESHHIRLKRLDSGEYIATLCSRCTRIDKLANGAVTYLNELKDHGARAPHGRAAPKNIRELLKSVLYLQEQAQALEKQSAKLSAPEIERRTDALATHLASLARDPTLEPVLALGAEGVKPLGVDVQPTVDATLKDAKFGEDALADKWLAASKATKAEKLPQVMADAALATTAAEKGSPLGGLKEATTDPTGRVEREAQRRIVHAYFEKLADAIEKVVAKHVKAGSQQSQPEFAAARRARDAIPLAEPKALASLAEPVPYTNAGEWETGLVRLSPEKRVALVNPMANMRAKAFGWRQAPFSSKLVKANRQRTLFEDSGGHVYSVDTLHGRFEMHDSNGTHLREINFDGAQTEGPLPSHNLRKSP